MKITIGKDGFVYLKDLFTVKQVMKIKSYSIDRSDSCIRIIFYDSKSNPIKVKLRGKAKKA